MFLASNKIHLDLGFCENVYGAFCPSNSMDMKFKVISFNSKGEMLEPLFT